MILLPPRCKIQFFEIIIYNFQLYIFAGEKISAATEISSSPVADINNYNMIDKSNEKK